MGTEGKRGIRSRPAIEGRTAPTIERARIYAWFPSPRAWSIGGRRCERRVTVPHCVRFLAVGAASGYTGNGIRLGERARREDLIPFLREDESWSARPGRDGHKDRKETTDLLQTRQVIRLVRVHDPTSVQEISASARISRNGRRGFPAVFKSRSSQADPDGCDVTRHAYTEVIKKGVEMISLSRRVVASREASGATARLSMTDSPPVHAW